MKERDWFLVFGLIQVMSLGFIIYFMLGLTEIGFDSRLVLAVMFSAFSLAVEYMIYSKK